MINEHGGEPARDSVVRSTASLEESRVTARRPWKAVLLTLLCPGLGHLYAGRPGRGAVVWVLYAVALMSGFGLALRLPGLVQLLSLILLALALLVVPAWDAAVAARRQSSPYRLRPYNRWYVYLAIVLIAAYGTQPVLISSMKASMGEAFRIPSGSMAPTLLIGDMIFTRKLRGSISRGQVIVHQFAGKPYIKRVVAGPGDTVAMRSGQLIINSRTVDEPYAERDTIDPVYTEFGWQSAHVGTAATAGSYKPST